MMIVLEDSVGNHADRKRARRRADAARQRQANRNETAARAGDDPAELSAKLQKLWETSTPADRKALDAAFTERVQAFLEHPGATRHSMEGARRLARMRDSRRLDDPAGTYPRLAAAVGRTRERIMVGVPLAGCHHLQAAPAPVFYCATCGDTAGLRCLTVCGKDHDKIVHGDDRENYRCDECGQIDRVNIHPIMPDPLFGVPIQFGDGEPPRILPTLVVISGFGTCHTCKTKAGQRRDRQQYRGL